MKEQYFIVLHTEPIKHYESRRHSSSRQQIYVLVLALLLECYIILGMLVLLFMPLFVQTNKVAEFN